MLSEGQAANSEVVLLHVSLHLMKTGGVSALELQMFAGFTIQKHTYELKYQVYCEYGDHMVSNF